MDRKKIRKKAQIFAVASKILAVFLIAVVSFLIGNLSVYLSNNLLDVTMDAYSNRIASFGMGFFLLFIQCIGIGPDLIRWDLEEFFYQYFYKRRQQCLRKEKIMDIVKKSKLYGIITKIIVFILIEVGMALVCLIVESLLNILLVHSIFADVIHEVEFAIGFFSIPTCILSFIVLSDWNIWCKFYKYFLRKTDAVDMLCSRFEYSNTMDFIAYDVMMLIVDGEKVDLTEKRKKKELKKVLEGQKRVTALCNPVDYKEWDLEHEAMILSVSTKEILNQLSDKKNRPPRIEDLVYVVKVRNRYVPNKVLTFIGNLNDQRTEINSLTERIQNLHPRQIAEAILEDHGTKYFRTDFRTDNNLEDIFYVKKTEIDEHHYAWMPLSFTGEECTVCYSECGCVCCNPDVNAPKNTWKKKKQKTSENNIVERNESIAMEQEDVMETNKRELLERVKQIDKKLESGFDFHSIDKFKWENTYKKELTELIISKYRLDDITEDKITSILEKLENDLYDTGEAAEQLKRETSLDALDKMLLLDGIENKYIRERSEERSTTPNYIRSLKNPGQ